MKTAMIRVMNVLALSVLVFGGRAAFAQEFKYRVEHDHLFKSCKGELVINQQGVEYRTDNKDHGRNWAYADIQMIRLASARKIEVVSYESGRKTLGNDRTFEFKVLEGEISKEVSDFLLARVARPLATSFVATEEKPRYEAAVRHRQRFGSDQGRLRVFADRVVYESAKPTDSRSWRWTDIKSISRTGPYQLSITTFEPQFGGPTRTYNFDLKDDRGDALYDLLWANVYRPTLPMSPGDERQAQTVRP